ncbi:MAG: nuclear transport factor 2 family protein [Bacteroidota bacterium]
MKKLLLSFLCLTLITACAPKEKELSADDISREQQAIINVMKKYLKSVEDKNFSQLVETLASEVVFYGTDSSEVLKTFPEFKKAMLKQWSLFDRQKYGEMSEVSIQMDKNATFASIIFGISFDVTIGDKTARLYLRMARILKKEDNKGWVIVSGIVGSTSQNESKLLDELVKAKTQPGQ